MAAKKTDLDLEIQRLYRQPLDDFTPARNELVKQLRKPQPQEADRVRALTKPTPSAWAVNVLFEREAEKMETLLAAGRKAGAAQREAVSGRGAAALRESIEGARILIEDLRRRGAALLAEAGRSVSRPMIDRIGTNLQALAFSPAAAEEAGRHWLDRDLDPPGFEVLAGLQLAGAPVVDLAARRAQREEKPERNPRPAPEPRAAPSRERKERERQEAAEKARREKEEERIRRRVAVAEEKLERAQKEADASGQEAESAEKAAAEARRQADAAEVAAKRIREKADRAAERLARAREELRDAKEGR